MRLAWSPPVKLFKDAGLPTPLAQRGLALKALNEDFADGAGHGGSGQCRDGKSKKRRHRRHQSDCRDGSSAKAGWRRTAQNAYDKQPRAVALEMDLIKLA